MMSPVRDQALLRRETSTLASKVCDISSPVSCLRDESPQAQILQHKPLTSVGIKHNLFLITLQSRSGFPGLFSSLVHDTEYLFLCLPFSGTRYRLGIKNAAFMGSLSLNLLLLIISCVTLGKSLILSGTLFSRL